MAPRLRDSQPRPRSSLLWPRRRVSRNLGTILYPIPVFTGTGRKVNAIDGNDDVRNALALMLHAQESSGERRLVCGSPNSNVEVNEIRGQGGSKFNFKSE